MILALITFFWVLLFFYRQKFKMNEHYIDVWFVINLLQFSKISSINVLAHDLKNLSSLIKSYSKCESNFIVLNCLKVKIFTQEFLINLLVIHIVTAFIASIHVIFKNPRLCCFFWFKEFIFIDFHYLNSKFEYDLKYLLVFLIY